LQCSLTILRNSKKIGEENEQIRLNGPPPERVYPKFKDPGSNENQVVGIPDDEESVVAPPSKAPSCGACRTRESKLWWKAPRGLNTAFLCDTCGTNWRKYADLNVRPTREDSVPATKQKTSEKREGTPLTAPPPKRTKVFFQNLYRWIDVLTVVILSDLHPHSQLRRLLALPIADRSIDAWPARGLDRLGRFSSVGSVNYVFMQVSNRLSYAQNLTNSSSFKPFVVPLLTQSTRRNGNVTCVPMTTR